MSRPAAYGIERLQRMANFVTASFSGGSASPLVHMLVLSKTVSVTLFGAREALSGRL